MALTKTLGGGGGSSLMVKDEGSTLSSAVTSIDVVGPTLTATNVAGAVTLTGNGNPFYGGDDTPLTSPNVADDEFSTGASIDTAGTRFTGATAWAWRNQGVATAPVAGGSLFLVSAAGAGTIHFVEQTLAAGTCIYETHMLGIWGTANTWGHSGIFMLNTGGTVPSLCFGTARGDEGNTFQVVRFNSTTFSSAPGNTGRSHVGMTSGVYLRIERTATPNLIFSVSRNKRRWFTIFTVAEATHFASPANRVGLFHIADGAGGGEAEFEYFRRVA